MIVVTIHGDLAHCQGKGLPLLFIDNIGVDDEGVAVEIRKEVQDFAVLMEETLSRNDHKTGWGYDSPCSDSYLMGRLLQEVAETIPHYIDGGWAIDALSGVIESTSRAFAPWDHEGCSDHPVPPLDDGLGAFELENRIGELVDVANICMMLADRASIRLKKLEDDRASSKQ